MPLQNTVQAQSDFSAGEVDVTVKRDEASPLFKKGLRQCVNYRILNTNKLQQRFGRAAQFIPTGARIEEALMSPGNVFMLDFSSGAVTVRTQAGSSLFVQTGLPWGPNTLNSIVWDIFQLSIYITYPGMRPQVLTWDGVSTWSIASWTETVIGGQTRTPFYRLSPHGVTVLPSSTSGSVTLTFSTGMNLQAGQVGTLMRIANSQVLITAVASSTSATATVLQAIAPNQKLNFTASSAYGYVVGDVVIGSLSGAQGEVTSIPGDGSIHVQLFTGTSFIVNDNAVSPNGRGIVNVVTNISTEAILTWDDQIINSFRGFPSSVFVDQSRVGFCNFPALPNGILWSAVDLPTDAFANDASSPDNAIFELAPGRAQVRYVVPGPESSEFVFCDNAVHYIPITPANPLKPGSVGFNLLSSEGCGSIQPRVVQESIVYIAAGGTSARAVTATGAYLRPYEVRFVSEGHDHIFAIPFAIASPGGVDPTYPERYVYIANFDGSVAVAKIRIENGQIVGDPGWVKWNGVGVVQWVAARPGSPNVWFSTTYPSPAITVAELIDSGKYMDAVVPVNNLPSGLAPPGGKGPLWWYAGGTVTLMDQATRPMGTYQIDANGFIIPQNNAGENLTAATLFAGQAFTCTAEPFISAPGPGQDIKQRMVRRKVSRMALAYQNSTGCLLARLFTGPLTRTSPSLGTIMNSFRITTFNQDDDPTKAPPLRESSQFWRPSGRSYDPRVAVIKDVPGPLTILEIGMEITV